MSSTQIRAITTAELDQVSGGSQLVIHQPDGKLIINMAEKELVGEAIMWVAAGGAGGKGGKPKH
jgi:hypothetical protein